jgi:hypothetical protein
VALGTALGSSTDRSEQQSVGVEVRFEHCLVYITLSQRMAFRASSIGQ